MIILFFCTYIVIIFVSEVYIFQATVPASQTTWVVSADERAKYEVMFVQTDVDKDGYVSGHEIKDVFLQSGVPQSVLAHIWYVNSISPY